MSPEEQAAAHLEAGNARLDAGDLAAAAAEYRAGFALYPRASLLFNLGVAELRQERWIEAVEAFEGVLARPDATPEVQEESRAQLEKLHQKLALVELLGGAGSALSVDGRARGTLPLERPLRLLPGTHQLSATREGHHPFQRALDTPAGTRLSLTVTLEPLPPPPKPESRPRYWLWGTVGAAVVAGAVVGFFVLRDRPDEPCPVDQCIRVKF